MYYFTIRHVDLFVITGSCVRNFCIPEFILPDHVHHYGQAPETGLFPDCIPNNDRSAVHWNTWLFLLLLPIPGKFQTDLLDGIRVRKISCLSIYLILKMKTDF